MRKPQFFLVLLIIFSSCASEDNKPTTQNKLSREEARQLINQEIDKTKNNVGGQQKIIRVFSVYSVEKKDEIYIVKYIWSGTMQLPSVPPVEGEEYKASIEVKDDTAVLKVRQKEYKWEVIP